MIVHLSNEEVFELYCLDIGKPHELIVYYQLNGLVDSEALLAVRDIRGLPMPEYLETILVPNKEN